MVRVRNVATVTLLVLAGCADQVEVERAWDALGGSAEMHLHAMTPRVAERAETEIRDAYRRAEALFDGDDPQSALARLNRAAADEPYEIEDYDLYRCIKEGLDWARASQGAYDPSEGPLRRLWGLRDDTFGVPDDDALAAVLETVGWRKVTLFQEAEAVRFQADGMELDLTGIRQGYAIDMGARNFARAGVRAALLRLGDVRYAFKQPPGSEAWDVVIDDGSTTLGTARVANRFLAVAGGFATVDDPGTVRGRAILDVRTGRPAETDLLGVVAIADSGAAAQAIARALFVLGPQRGGDLLERTRRVEAVMLVRGTRGTYVLASASLEGALSVDETLESTVGGDVRYLLPPVRLD